MKKRILFLFLSLLALTGTALAVQHTDGSGAVWDTDETGYYAPEAPVSLAAALVEDLTPPGGSHQPLLECRGPRGRSLGDSGHLSEKNCH